MRSVQTDRQTDTHTHTHTHTQLVTVFGDLSQDVVVSADVCLLNCLRLPSQALFYCIQYVSSITLLCETYLHPQIVLYI